MPSIERTGYYAATIAFPRADDWTIEVVSGFGGRFDRSRARIAVLDGAHGPPDLTAVERGRRLFASKGCLTCHAHRLVEGRSTSNGPALTGNRYRPDHLRGVLTDPPRRGAVRGAQLADAGPGLNDVEVDALAAFLNGEDRQGPR